ncbi:flagellar motor protein MotB [Leptospira perolatii]|uniref:Flagellar motor protein MotB n=1 Tax=Leptospira perolatii TaxID=2023191 RepID=A0A2M9ZSN5_9LEPT|nr:flagellar motor protein MotB [Leptospira perolatii]PJZ71454.1 flagellar motor protein MotB [Leptospira perolatii]PJZ74989.1 flagellar motor protein MotB [Leptospira perolatii]
MANQKCPECIQAIPEYMLTYGDMVTLLLCFFIMLYKTGKTNAIEMQIILSAFKTTTGFFDGGQTLSKGKLEEMGMNIESLPSMTTGKALSKSKKTATELFKPEIEAGKVRVSEDERGLIISLVGADYFNPGSAILNEPIKVTLKKASGLIKSLERFIRVEGHCDQDSVIPGVSPSREERAYLNNWDLAGARAINATDYLIGVGKLDPSWFQAVSYGSYRPMVLENAGTPEAKALNRRIDIVILTDRSTKRGPHESNYGLPKSRLPGSESSSETGY